MALNKIDETIEKLSKNNKKSFTEIVIDLDLKEEDLQSWIETFSELAPKINENGEQYFTNRQFGTVKKIKKFVIEQEGNINDLQQINARKKSEKNLENLTKTKLHYFENNQQTNDDLISDFNEQTIPNIDNFITSQTLENNSQQMLNFEFQTQQNHESKFDNQIDLTAKLQDFSKIKLYDIHPKINQQIQHRLKCAKLNLEELNNLLKNL